MASNTADLMMSQDELLTMHLDAIFTDVAFKNLLWADIAAEKISIGSQKDLTGYISARLAELFSSDPKNLGFVPSEQS